jgi:hypothetical protein
VSFKIFYKSSIDVVCQSVEFKILTKSSAYSPAIVIALDIIFPAPYPSASLTFSTVLPIYLITLEAVLSKSKPDSSNKFLVSSDKEFIAVSKDLSNPPLTPL